VIDGMQLRLAIVLKSADYLTMSSRAQSATIVTRLRCGRFNIGHAVFGLCHLLGYRFAPRIKDLKDRKRDWCETGGAGSRRVFSRLSLDRGWGVEWTLKLAAAGGAGPCVDIMKIRKSDGLGDVASLGLTLAEAKQLLAGVQREISTAQAREHAVRRPFCLCGDGVCRVKDYRDHAVATLFGQGSRHRTGRIARFAARIGNTAWQVTPGNTPTAPRIERVQRSFSTYAAKRSAMPGSAS
jgi:hypothetical protein